MKDDAQFHNHELESPAAGRPAQVFSPLGLPLVPSTDFKPNQMVCLDQKPVVLYAEVVQVIEERDRCWVRPRWLVVEEMVYALDDRAPDLVWPSQDFRHALDTEVLPLVGEPLTPTKAAQGRYKLQQWVRGLRQTIDDE
ncbi:MAG: hypothetical protein F6J87_26365 [Spirulina sp. SIO3F2]|nr:hypothetical protein [Spirulina sp. SIO3F2]